MMSITARVKVKDEDLEAANVSITLTMSLTDWRKAMRQLTGEWPSWKIGMLIAEAIGDLGRSVDKLYAGTDVDQ